MYKDGQQEPGTGYWVTGYGNREPGIGLTVTDRSESGPYLRPNDPRRMLVLPLRHVDVEEDRARPVERDAAHRDAHVVAAGLQGRQEQRRREKYAVGPFHRKAAARLGALPAAIVDDHTQHLEGIGSG